jgi:TIR domain
MSVQSIQSNISSIQREIQNLQKKLTDKSRDEASKFSRIDQIRRSINKYTSPSSVESKNHEIGRIESEIVRIKSDIANINKQIADKTERLHKYQQDLYKAQAIEQDKMFKTLDKKQKEEAQRQKNAIANIVASKQTSAFDLNMLPIRLTSDSSDFAKLHDVFISHASEDKQEIARPLSDALSKLGCDVWYDEFQLKLGDSLRRSIDKGLANSRFGVVILSPSFFAKNWPQYELDGLVQREMAGGKVILPIWHKVSKNEVLSYSPSLADKLAMSTAQYTIEELAQSINEVLNPQ